ncbi:MAG: DUF134 domain-containing protein, partial [Clostridiales bacterium]|nr:DUF134 domain-containing protein [Clostridiales bacterium]
MPRPIKCRRVCHFPNTLEFTPKDSVVFEPIFLTLDEFEVIRLIDREGLCQEECGLQLGVARTTAQKIYDSARKKLADSFVDDRALIIQGGDYRVCNA